MKNKKTIMEMIISVVVFSLLTFILTAYSPLHILTNGDSSIDSSVFKLIASMMHKGYMPYRDTFDHKGPLLYIINYIGSCISSYRGIWVVECVFIIATLTACYYIARMFTDRILSACTMIFVSDLFLVHYAGGNFVQEYAMPFIAIALFIFLDYEINEKINVLRLIICGICFAAICLLQPNMAAVWVVFCIDILIRCIQTKDFKSLGKFLLWFMIGAFVLILPVVFWLAANGAFNAFVDDYLLFNMKYISASWESRFSALIFFAKTPVTIIAMVLSLFICIRRHRRVDIVSFVYLIFSLLLTAISGIGASAEYYGLILVPAVVYPIASFLELLKGFALGKKEQGANEEALNTDLQRNSGYYLLCVAILICGIFTFPIGIRCQNLIDKYNDPEQSRHSGMVMAVSQIIQDNSEPDDRITVWGNWDIIYLMSDRLPASTFSYQYPIGYVNPEFMDKYFEELSENNPKIIAFFRDPEETNLTDQDKRLDSFIEENGYSLIGTYEDNYVAYVYGK